MHVCNYNNNFNHQFIPSLFQFVVTNYYCYCKVKYQWSTSKTEIKYMCEHQIELILINILWFTLMNKKIVALQIPIKSTYFKPAQTRALKWESKLLLYGVWVAMMFPITPSKLWNTPHVLLGWVWGHLHCVIRHQTT